MHWIGRVQSRIELLEKKSGKMALGNCSVILVHFGCRSWVSMGEFRCGDNVIYFDLISDLPGNQIKI
jgi:hypothetical protein